MKRFQKTEQSIKVMLEQKLEQQILLQRSAQTSTTPLLSGSRLSGDGEGTELISIHTLCGRAIYDYINTDLLVILHSQRFLMGST